MVSERVFYLPHRPVISLETGPPLKNRLWDALIHSRFRPILLCGDIIILTNH